nr:hypothetical protein Iba_chr06aCG4630 [Ipomoea batatas]
MPILGMILRQTTRMHSCTSGFSSSRHIEPEPSTLLGRVMQGSMFLSWLRLLLTETKTLPFSLILEGFWAWWIMLGATL